MKKVLVVGVVAAVGFILWRKCCKQESDWAAATDQPQR